MASDEPLSDARLAEIRAWAGQSPATLGQGYAKASVYAMWLLDEVERLRAEREQVMEVVRAVADAEVVKAHPQFGEMTIRVLGGGELFEQARAVLDSIEGVWHGE